MIHGISGKSGGGKSYEAVVSHIIPIITKEKRKVVTNLPLNIEHFVSVFGEYTRDLIEYVEGDFHEYGDRRPFSRVEDFTKHDGWKNDKNQRVYFFIDECHLAMPKQSDKALIEFMSLARHAGYDIMLITQNFRKVNADIKDNIVNHYRAIKKSMIGQDDKYILKVHDGHAATQASVVATHERVYEKKYFSFYKSHTKSDGAVVEASTNDIVIWWKHWTIKAAVVMVLFFIFILKSAFSSHENKQKTIEETLNKNTEQEQKIEPKNDSKPVQVPVIEKDELTDEQLEVVNSDAFQAYSEMIKKSKKYHPFYKVDLSIQGHADYVEGGRRVHTHYFSASQNGQHVFTIKSADLLLAGYEIRVLGECAVKINFHNFEDYLTCNAPSQSTKLGGAELARN